MPIPVSRAELVAQVSGAFSKLRDELGRAGPGVGDLECIDDWTVQDVLAVRTWWTHAVIDWVEAGRQGQSFPLPAEGYRWSETPRLNSDVITAASEQPYESIIEHLEKGFERVIACLDSLSDRELLDTGVFVWAGKWPVSRWISINTTRQYVTARAFVRKAMRANSSADPPGAAS